MEMKTSLVEKIHKQKELKKLKFKIPDIEQLFYIQNVY